MSKHIFSNIDIQTDLTATNIKANTASGLNLKTDDNNIRIKVTDTGIVGIGTETPSVSLHINHTDAIKIPKGTTAERPTATGAEHTGYIRYNSTLNQFEGFGAGNAWGSLGGVIDIDQDTKILAEENSDEDKLRFYTDGTQRMIIDNTGNVGINAASPQSTLEVDGNVRIGTISAGVSSLNPSGRLVISSSGSSSTNIEFRTDDINLNSQDYNTSIIESGFTSTSWNSGYIKFKTHSSDTSSFTDDMIIKGGRVGVGTNTPNNRLSVIGTGDYYANEGIASFYDNNNREICIGGLGIFRRDHNGAADLRINYIGYNGGITQFRDFAIYDGKIGIIGKFIGSTKRLGLGTLYPSNNLDIRVLGSTNGIDLRNESGYLLFRAARATSSTTAYFGIYDGTAATNDLIVFQSSGDSYINTGNFGIGTKTPSTKLEVNGTTTTTTLNTTTLQINSASVTSTSTELNIVDGDTTIETTAVSDGHGVVINQGGTMKQINVTTLSEYFDDEITNMPNLTSAASLNTVGTLDSGVISSNFGNIDIGSSTFTTTGSANFGVTTSNTTLSDIYLETHEDSGITTILVTVAAKDANHRYNGQGSGSGYIINGKQSPYLNFVPGKTYKFDQSDNTNSTHPLLFYLDAGKTTQYSTNVTTNGTPGSAGAYTQIIITEDTPSILFYQCSAHGYMGNQIQIISSRDFTSAKLTTPQINDTSSDHQYIFGVSELAADRTITLPLLTGNDEFVFKEHTQTLTNKTLTSPTITGTGAIAGIFTGDLTGNVTGNADTATKIASITNSNIVQLT